MRSKNQTPIGFLIEIMDIKVKDLAENIFIDLSTISRWKSGRRLFTAKCDCFDKVVDYFLLHNNQSNQNILENLFDNLYGPPARRGKDYLKKCLEQFLSHNIVPVEAQSILAQSNGNLYMCQTGVFSGIDGRKTAMDLILSAAENSQEPIELLLFDRELFRWCIYDDEYIDGWTQKLSNILSKENNKVDIIIETSTTNDLLGYFVNKTKPLYSFPNYSEYYFVSDVNINLLPTTYNVKGRLSALGYNQDNSLYTCIFKDKFTIEHGFYYLSNLKKECVETFTPLTISDRIEMINKMCRYEEMDEYCYVLSGKPSFLTMNEELLKQILKDNDVIGEIKNSIMRYYSTINNEMNKTDGKRVRRHILFYSYLADYLRSQRIFHHELSYLIGKNIYISNQQYREHLRHTAGFALADNNYNIAISCNLDKLPSESFLIRCRRKFYAIILDKRVRLNCENSAVNNIFSIIDSYWRKDLPLENKDQDYVAKKLIEFADS